MQDIMSRPEQAIISTLIISILARATGLNLAQANEQTTLNEIGLDSLAALNFNSLIQPEIPGLKKTLLFDCRTIGEVASYILQHHADCARQYIARQQPATQTTPASPPEDEDWPELGPLPAPSSAERDIAIIGVHARYPAADSLAGFWRNLAQGLDAICEIPPERWALEGFYQAGADARSSGLSYARWGGFLRDIDEFDARFFAIPAREALCLDPQERLFLQCAWHALEDSGHAGERAAQLRHASGALDMGVFVGVTSNTFPLLGPALWQQGDTAIPTGMPWSVANRVSYTLNCCGPSLAIDTACSSSLTALHLAIESLRKGECRAALVGGVNLYTHPAKYVQLCQQHMLSPTGRCHAFGEQADGFVPGEGVAAVLLRPLADARRDGDRILAVIKGSAINHGGRANGYTVPNAGSQAALIRSALQDARVPAASISYIEAHGTGTRLGDPIEIDGLSQVLDGEGAQQPCHVGSVKSGIGHLESAAGMASLTKVLLQLQHRQLAPSIHADNLNPHLDLQHSRLRIVRQLQPWSSSGWPLRAGISSFGAGGSNAHVIIEEAPQQARTATPGPEVFVLSARTREQLLEQAAALQADLDNHATPAGWQALAYTLQCGRRSFEHRFAMAASTPQQLRTGLQALQQGAAPQHWHQGHVLPGQLEQDDGAMLEAGALAARWVAGQLTDWSRFWSQPPLPVAAPLYPFARERHWPAVRSAAPARNRVHTRSLAASDFFLRDHVIQQVPVLPAAAYIDFCREEASRRGLGAALQLRNLTWAAPITARDEHVGVQCQCEEQDDGLQFAFQASGTDSASFRAHCSPLQELAPASVDLQALRAACPQVLEPQALYQSLQQLGIHYGPSFRCLQAAYLGDGQALTQIEAQLQTRASNPLSALDPALLDAVLQSAFVTSTAAGLTFVPYACRTLHYHAPLTAQLQVHVRPQAIQRDDMRVFDFSVLDPQGRVLVEIREFVFRVYQATSRSHAVQLLEPAWQETILPQAPAHLSGTTLVISADEQLPLPAGCWRVLPRREFLYRDERTLEADLTNPAHVDLLLRLLQSRQQVLQCVAFNLLQPLQPDTPHWADALQLTDVLLASQLLRHLCQQMAAPRLQVRLLLAKGFVAAVGGLLRLLALELPGISACVIEVTDAPAHYPAGQLAAALLAATEPGVQQLRLQPQRCLRRTLRFVEPLMPASALPLLNAGDLVVITGGLGAIGRLFAEALARQGGLHLALLGRRAPSVEDQAWLQHLQQLGAASADCWSTDCADANALQRTLAQLRQRHGGIQAVLHCAGVLRDDYFVRQGAEDIQAVLSAKAQAALLLDQATAGDALKLFMVCSSLAGIHGNIGQSLYALANAWLDAFIEQRARQRSGRSLSVAWPLWQTTHGMQAPAPVRQWLQEHGLDLLPEAEGVATFLQALTLPQTLLIPVYGQRAAVARLFAIEAATSVPATTANHLLPDAAGDAGTAESVPAAEGAVLDYLARQVAAVTATPLQRIDADAALEVFGLDSILVMELNGRLEKQFPNLSKTVLFEVRSLRELAGLLQSDFPADCARLQPQPAAPGTTPAQSAPVSAPASQTAAVTTLPADVPPVLVPTAAPAALPETRAADSLPDGIAIIGLAGRYPGSRDPQTLWQHLAAGHDLVSEIDGRWEQPAGADGLYARWGGMVEDFDCFDPLFFGISPRDAERMDPQERLFLQAAWHAIENAGYTPQSLSGSRQQPQERRRVAVIAGVMYGEYQFYGAGSWPQRPEILTNSSYASIANRVSYCLDLDGPSFAVDSMCSSSLTSLHLACDLIRSGSCEMALAGGVNLSQHPYKYRTLCELGFASSQGQCRSFGSDGDGYVPGEGVGVVLLKPLAQALRDGDYIHGVIRGSELNHGGRTSGYTVPNADAQSQVIARALTRSRLPVQQLGYIEAHGTGTSLGDPIEIRGLAKAIAGKVPEGWRCPIGSIKSNVGHLESAAGIAALTKVLLQLRHHKLAPSLHATPANPNIDFASTPFVVQQTLADWPAPLDSQQQPLPRAAAISSFGAGGANAHLIVEEQPLPASVPAATGVQPFVFSAQSLAQLRSQLQHFVEFLEAEHSLSGQQPASHLGLHRFTSLEVASTLLHGRRRCEEAQLAVIARDFDELRQLLGQWLLQEDAQATGLLVRDPDSTPPCMALARQWLAGERVTLAQGQHLRKVPLPGYEFLRRRYWAGPQIALAATPEPAAAQPDPLPLPAAAALDAPPASTAPLTPEEILDRVRRNEISAEQARALLQRMA